MVLPHEFDVGDNKFSVTKLPGKVQLQMLKRVAPLVPPLLPLLTVVIEELRGLSIAEIAAEEEAAPQEEGAEAQAPKPRDKPVDTDRLMMFATPFTTALSDLKDSDLDWLTEQCCANLQYLQLLGERKTWVKFWSPQARKPMFEDLDDSAVLLPIVVNVVLHNLRPFINGLLTNRLGLPLTRK